MREAWQKHSVADLISLGVLYIGDGYRAKLEELGPSGLPFARAGNISSGFHFEDTERFPESDLWKVGEKASRPRDVVLTSKGTVGRFAFVRETTQRFVYSPQLCFWRVLRQDRVEPRFLFYWMSGREFYVQYKGVSAQTDMAEYVSLADQRRMHMTLPSLDEQRAIAYVLGTLDEKIELNRRMNETLEAMAQAIFKSWFVDFDPVRAKAEGRQPVGMDPENATLFPNSFEDKIPKGWSLRRLGDVVAVNERSISLDYPHATIEYVEISSVSAGQLLETARLELPEAPSRAKRLVSHGDTIWSCVRPNRKSYLYIRNPPPNLVVSTGFAILTPKKIPPSYLYQWITTDDFVEYLSYSADGSAYPAVRPDRFSDAQLLVPPPAVLDKFEGIVGAMRDKIACNAEECGNLASIRDTLLPKLISGEIRIKAAEKFVQAELGVTKGRSSKPSNTM